MMWDIVELDFTIVNDTAISIYKHGPFLVLFEHIENAVALAFHENPLLGLLKYVPVTL